ncbi:MAG: N-acetylmuramoyl-L-alanine amidase [Candidatus Sulfotelmatobacter sp.]|nr:N-acetylmuramoyl-L-alanine amidase [Candidatus Sulfotelmatobacter sp.]
MRSIRRGRVRTIANDPGKRAVFVRAAVGVLLVLAVLLVSAAAPEKHLSVFSTAANYSLPVIQRQGQDYIGLLELLDPLGTVSAKSDPTRWRLHYNNILGEFTVGKSRARIQGRDADLSGRFLIENGRGLVPLASLNSLLPRFLGGPATLHEESNRLFIGNISTHFTASISPDDPSRLVFRFTAPVNPSVASEPGKLRLTFRREPLTGPASPMLTFGSRVIPSADYSENNGAAEIEVTTSVPLLASFSADGRTITLAPPKSPTATNTAAANGAGTSGAGAPTASSPATAAAQSNAPPASSPTAPALTPLISRRYFAIVDASHGGNDRGETLSPSLAEKDITVAFARRLRQELESRGITTLLLRDSDANLSLDDRAYFANTTHAAVYIALHAASNGHGVRLYTALLPYSSDDDRGPFRSWNSAQTSSVALSQATAASVGAELRKVQVTVRTLTAPLRPLNNIVTAAIAVEVAPPASNVSPLVAPDYQQLIAGAVANGIVAIRAQLGAAP